MTTDGDVRAATERVRRVVVRVASGWVDQPQAEYEAAVEALDLIVATLSDTEAELAGAHKAAEGYEALIREQEAELERYRGMLEIARRMQRLAARALTQDSPPG